MKFFAMFVEERDGIVNVHNKKDSVFILDGRNRITIMIKDCKNRMKKMTSTHPEYIGFRIYEGTPDSNFMIYHEPKDYDISDKGMRNDFEK